MNKTETNTLIRRELDRLVGQSFVRPNVALTAVMRRKGASDYRIAIDDAALLSAIGAMIQEQKQTNILLASIDSKLGNIDIDTDNLAGIKTNTANTKVAVDAVKAEVTNVDASVKAGNTKLDAVNTKLDTANTKLGNVDNDLDSANNKLDGLHQQLETIEINTRNTGVE